MCLLIRDLIFVELLGEFVVVNNSALGQIIMSSLLDYIESRVHLFINYVIFVHVIITVINMI